MPTQLSLFDCISEAVESAEKEKVIILRDLTVGFISPAQRHIAENNPLFFQFKNRTLEEIEAIDKAYGKKFYQSAKHQEWLYAYWTAQTIALEKLYRMRDERFLNKYSGKFWLVISDGDLQEVQFDYSPCLFFESATRVTVPNPHIEFRTQLPSPISETGYRSHFLNCIPFNDVSSMEELMTLIVKAGLKVKEEILFTLDAEHCH